MMLVKTAEGFQPAPIDPHTQYVWDQPLHPEREQRPVAGPAPAREAVTNGNNGNGHHAENGARLSPRVGVPARPAPAPEAAPIPEPAVVEPQRVEAPPPPATLERPVEEPAPVLEVDSPHREEPVTVSKIAVGVAIALAVGLPFGSKALNLSKSEPEAVRRPAVAGAPGAPAPIAAVRSGFVQVSGDAVRYAVVLKNPNRALTARAVSVDVSLFDAKGRVIGSDVERIAALHPGATAIAGTTDADGAVARLAVRLSSDGFLAGPARPFTVHSVGLSRSGDALIVRASLTGRRASKGARVVAVHFDARGAILGGDVTYVDIPRSPHTTTAAIRTSGADARVRRVEVYVLAPR